MIFLTLYRDFSGPRRIWLTQGNSYTKKSFYLSAMGSLSGNLLVLFHCVKKPEFSHCEKVVVAEVPSGVISSRWQGILYIYLLLFFIPIKEWEEIHFWCIFGDFLVFFFQFTVKRSMKYGLWLAFESLNASWIHSTSFPTLIFDYFIQTSFVDGLQQAKSHKNREKKNRNIMSGLCLSQPINRPGT